MHRGGRTMLRKHRSHRSEPCNTRGRRVSRFPCNAGSVLCEQAADEALVLAGNGSGAAMAAPYLVLRGNDVPGAGDSCRVVSLRPVGRLEGPRRLLQSSPAVLIPCKYSVQCWPECYRDAGDLCNVLVSLQGPRWGRRGRTQPVPTASATAPPQDVAEPFGSAGGTSGKTYLLKGRKCQT